MSSEQDYEALLDQFKWCAAVLNILVQLEGGRVEIDRKTLEELDLYSNAIQVSESADGTKYIVESVETENNNAV